MPRFTIVPTDPGAATAELVAADASAIFPLINQMGLAEADVQRNRVYVFSMRQTVGFWTIFDRASG